jgi:hypothetical protein
MPREAKLFASSGGSVVRGYLKFRANIPPRWIKNARGSRKRIEPEISENFRSPNVCGSGDQGQGSPFGTRMRELRLVLDRWDTAYRKENFYRGIRILLELQREARPVCKLLMARVKPSVWCTAWSAKRRKRFATAVD